MKLKRILTVFASLAAFAVSPAPTALATDLPVGGMNLDGVETYSTAVPFANSARQGSNWVGVNGSLNKWYDTGVSKTLDANGYPTDWAAGYSLFFPVFEHTNVYPLGQYRLSWDGAANLTLDYGYGNGSIVSSGANYKVYNVTACRYDGLRVTLPNGEQGKTVSNIRLEIPGHHNATGLFNSAMLTELGNFGVIRMMDWMKTNNSVVDTWDDRTKPSSLFWTGNAGVPYEAMVALANDLDSDLWVCVPHAANDAYVTNLANLLRFGSNGDTPYTSTQTTPVWPGLEAGRRVWIEYSNEAWSPGAPGPAQYNYINDTLRPAYGLPDANRAYGRRAREIFTLFETAFNGTDRLVRVIAGQNSTPHVASRALFEAGDKADVLAIASYIGGEVASGSSIPAYIVANNYSTSIYPELWQALRDNITDSLVPRLREHVTIARGYGIPVVTYEGGPGVVGTGDTQQNDASLTSYLTTFHQQAEWGNIVKEHLNAMRAAGLATHVAYEYVRSSGKAGYFGHKTHQGQPLGDANTAGSAHKLRELINWVNNPGSGPADETALTTGQSFTTDNDGSDFTSFNFQTQTSGTGFIGTNWLSRDANISTVATARWTPRLQGREGRYEISVSRGGGNRTTNQPFTVRQGDITTTRTVDLKNATGSWVSLGSFTLLDLDRVQTTNQFTPSGDTKAVADAVRFTKVADDITTGLVGRWELNETSGTSAADSRPSGTANNGALKGNTAWSTSGQARGAAAFDGTNDWIEIADSADYHGQKLSFTAWVNSTTSDANPRALLSKRTGVNNQQAFAAFTHTGGRLFVDIGTQRTDTGLVLGTGWKHVAVVFDGALSTNRLKVYIDGASTPSFQGNPGTVTSVPDTTGLLHIGILNASYGYAWNGKIDDVRIYNRALTATEIAVIKTITD